jgi:hypothetical protein
MIALWAVLGLLVGYIIGRIVGPDVCSCGMPRTLCEELVSAADNEYMMRCGESLPCMWHTKRHTCEVCGCTNYVRPRR